jgi:predicted regulator of Ras-like GTPase activity (Roadblock/LC7/MglB family)
MHAELTEIAAVPGVRAVMVFAADGRLVAAVPAKPPAGAAGGAEWTNLIRLLEGVREADLVFAAGRVIVRRGDGFTLAVLAQNDVASAVIRLHCDIILPRLALGKPARGLKRFFRR